MPVFYEYLDEHLMSAMYKYQSQQLDVFKARLENMCSKEQNSWNYRINIYCGDVSKVKPIDKEYVAYSSDLIIDFTNWI